MIGLNRLKSFRWQLLWKRWRNVENRSASWLTDSFDCHVTRVVATNNKLKKEKKTLTSCAHFLISCVHIAVDWTQFFKSKPPVVTVHCTRRVTVTQRLQFRQAAVCESVKFTVSHAGRWLTGQGSQCLCVCHMVNMTRKLNACRMLLETKYSFRVYGNSIIDWSLRS